MPSDPLSVTLTIIALVFIILGAVFALTFRWLRRLSRQRQQAMMARYPNARQVISGANFLGEESKGISQVTGNGTLVITESDIVFERWVPRKDYVIPLNRIVAIELPTSFLGETGFRALLKVVYRTDTGEQDAIAWAVEDADGLKSLLEQLRTSLSLS